jgi:hypothetical protein
MEISLLDESTSIRWRRLAIVGDTSALTEPCAVLDKAQIPHIIGLYHRYKTPVDKPSSKREAEYWVMVPFQNYSAACSALFSITKCRNRKPDSAPVIDPAPDPL